MGRGRGVGVRVGVGVGAGVVGVVVVVVAVVVVVVRSTSMRKQTNKSSPVVVATASSWCLAVQLCPSDSRSSCCSSQKCRSGG